MTDKNAIYTPKIALTHGQIEDIVKIIRRHLTLSNIYLFGSRATGKAKKYSDVDIALEDKNNIDPTVILTIEAELEEVLPYRVDLIDLDKVSKEFEAVVRREGVLLG